MKKNNYSICFYDRNIKNVSHKYYPKLESQWQDVSANRLEFSKLIATTPVFLRQIHSAICFDADEFKGDYQTLDIAADGMVTSRGDIALVIQTADCVPVLFVDKHKKIIGAAHSGWRGAIGGILENTVEMMHQKGAEEIIAYIGPCIAQKNYEISQDFYQKFIDLDQQNAKFFIPGEEEKYFFDLGLYVEDKLIKIGVKEIFNSNIDTYGNENYFSFRRFCHQKEAMPQVEYGSNLSVISLNLNGSHIC